MQFIFTCQDFKLPDVFPSMLFSSLIFGGLWKEAKEKTKQLTRPFESMIHQSCVRFSVIIL